MLVDIHTNLMWYPDHMSDEFVEFAYAAKRAKMRLTPDVYFAGHDDKYKNAFDSTPEALLEAKGADKRDHAHTESDPELLMEAMESREALADAETAEEVAELEARTRLDVEISEEALSVAFAADDLEGASGIVTRLKYLLKLLQEIRRKRLILQS